MLTFVRSLPLFPGEQKLLQIPLSPLLAEMVLQRGAAGIIGYIVTAIVLQILVAPFAQRRIGERLRLFNALAKGPEVIPECLFHVRHILRVAPAVEGAA